MSTVAEYLGKKKSPPKKVIPWEQSMTEIDESYPQRALP